LKSTLPHGIELKINSPSGDYPEPEAHAGILQIENLPCNTNNKLLYDLFRPFGPMILCNIKLEQDLTFKGIALVQYFHSENAQHAQDVMVNNKSLYLSHVL
jgi:RNA recognition motif-containing protein